MSLQPDNAENSPADVPEDSVEQTLVEESAWIAPLPEPDAIRQYNEIIHGAAERILAMAENQQKHDHNQDDRRLDILATALRADSRRSSWGLLAGFLIAAVGLGGGIFLIYAGHDWAGGIIATVNLASVAGVFVYGTHSRRAERSDGEDE